MAVPVRLHLRDLRNDGRPLTGLFDIKALRRKLRGSKPRPFQPQFAADGLGVRKRNLAFLDEPRFVAAWQAAAKANEPGWPAGVPDIRWRAHIACWAATHALTLEGDFVECGVHTGLLSLTIARYLDFQSLDRRFWLFDTYEGIPLDTVAEDEKAMVREHNDLLYFDVYEIAKRNFAPFPNAHLVKGTVPQTLEATTLDKVAYLSIDLNNSTAERAALEHFWPKLAAGALVVFDDYGWAGYEPQTRAADDFARAHGTMVATLPTGQGLLIKT